MAPITWGLDNAGFREAQAVYLELFAQKASRLRPDLCFLCLKFEEDAAEVLQRRTIARATAFLCLVTGSRGGSLKRGGFLYNVFGPCFRGRLTVISASATNLI